MLASMSFMRNHEEEAKQLNGARCGGRDDVSTEGIEALGHG
jgi:hypothetical protein